MAQFWTKNHCGKNPVDKRSIDNKIDLGLKIFQQTCLIPIFPLLAPAFLSMASGKRSRSDTSYQTIPEGSKKPKGLFSVPLPAYVADLAEVKSMSPHAVSSLPPFSL